MGCNCKKTYDKMEKYSDGYNGILVGGIVIVMIVPIIVFLIGCLIVGKEPKFNFIKKKKDIDGK